MKAAIIVAHPDDEIIWAGGLIMQNPHWEWTVLSLSRANDPDRCPKFRSVCKLLGLTGFISDLDDANPPKPINTNREIGGRITEYLKTTPWDMCITHGSNGEYGHPRHKQTHQQVLDMINEGTLECKELWTFAYECDAEMKKCTAAAEADVLIDLTEQELLKKRLIVQQEYGYGKDSFEVGACISPEAFRRRERSFEEQIS